MAAGCVGHACTHLLALTALFGAQPDKGFGLFCLISVWLQTSKVLPDVSQALSTISIELEYGLSLAVHALQGL